MARRPRPMSRQKKTALALAVLGIGGGAAAYFLFIRKKKVTPTISSAGIVVKRVPVANVSADVYTKGTPANKTFTEAQDAWHEIHPDEPFINDDGTCNLLPGYEGNIPGCLGWE